MKNGHLLQERIAKLPDWAKAHILSLERQREEAIRKLSQFTDGQKWSPFYVDELACLTPGSPTTVRRYVDAYRINFLDRGLDLSITTREEGVSIQYGQLVNGMKDIMFQPTSYQSFVLKYPEHKR